MSRKSLLITKFFPPNRGGIQNYLYNICKNIEKDKIFVLTEKGNKNQENFRISSYKIKKIYSSLSLSFLPVFFKASKIIKENSIENLYLGHFYIPYAISALILNKFKNIPYTIFTHGLEILETRNSPKSNYILKLCLKNAQNVIVTTNYLKKEIVNKYPSLSLDDKIIKIPPGVDSNHFRPNLNTSDLVAKHDLENKKIILTCGRLVKRKNHQLIVKALPEILKKVPNVIYLIAGTGPEEKNLRKQVNELGLEKSVRFLGEVENKDLPLFYSLADVFCMPSIYNKEAGDIEGFGLVFLEAQACGTPTIGSNTGGIPDAISNNIDGYLVNLESSQELASRITKLLLNNDLAQQFGRAGREKVIREHDWSKLVERLPQ
ncbi:MAG: glycosyltransferase family 4 protein [Parcubacteria group bacterium]|nr:glycosyltransferase family 4 protein [Parcubacteria group bacterium]